VEEGFELCQILSNWHLLVLVSMLGDWAHDVHTRTLRGLSVLFFTLLRSVQWWEVVAMAMSFSDVLRANTTLYVFISVFILHRRMLIEAVV
jgi:hypothetical protein